LDQAIAAFANVPDGTHFPMPFGNNKSVVNLVFVVNYANTPKYDSLLLVTPGGNTADVTKTV